MSDFLKIFDRIKETNNEQNIEKSKINKNNSEIVLKLTDFEKKIINSNENEIILNIDNDRYGFVIKSIINKNIKTLFLRNKKNNTKKIKKTVERTYYSIAYKFYGNILSHKLNENYAYIYDYNIISRKFTDEKINKKYLYLIYESLKKFCKSVNSDIEKKHVSFDLLFNINSEIEDPLTINIILNDMKIIWNSMMDLNTFTPIFHDFYVKLMDLNNLDIGYDLYLCEDYENISDCFKKVLKNQKGKKIIINSIKKE